MRWRVAPIGLIALVPIGALIGWWFMTTSPINAANCDRIEVGMPILDVQQMLGSEGEDFMQTFAFEEERPAGIKVWQDGRRWIVVNYYRGTVQETMFFERTLWEHLQDRYHGREWHPLYREKRLESAA